MTASIAISPGSPAREHGVRFVLVTNPLPCRMEDPVLVDDVASDPRDLAVLRAIVAMAGALGLQVIAEGVESEAQRATIAEEGCAYYQGFLRAQPIGAEEFLKFASSRA